MYGLQYVFIITYISRKVLLKHMQDLLTVGVFQETLEVVIGKKFAQRTI